MHANTQVTSKSKTKKRFEFFFHFKISNDAMVYFIFYMFYIFDLNKCMHALYVSQVESNRIQKLN